MSAPPVGSHPDGFWAALECAFLNTYQARWQYFADTLGLGFAQGKTLFCRARRHRGRRRLAHARSRGGGGCGLDQAGARARAHACASSMRRSSSRWHAALRRRLGPPSALGAAAARQLCRVLLSRDRRRRCAAARCCDAHRCRDRRAGRRNGSRLLRAMVWRGNAAWPRPQAGTSRSLIRCTPCCAISAAGALGQRLARTRLRLARQCDERGQSRRPKRRPNQRPPPPPQPSPTPPAPSGIPPPPKPPRPRATQHRAPGLSARRAR